MKFDPNNEEQGLFFRSTKGIERRSGLYAQIQPSVIVAQVPADLGDGEYSLVLRTVSRGGKRLEGRSESAFRIGE